MNSSERIIETYNMFLNSDDNVGNGQNYDFQFGNNSITTRDKGQFIRMNLVNFNMYKNWTDVNGINAGFCFVSNGGATISPVVLDSQNYTTLRDLAKNWADNFLAVATLLPLAAGWGASAVASWTPDAGTGINGTTNNILSFIINTTNAHGVAALLALANGSFNLCSTIDPNNYAGGNPAGIAIGADSAALMGGDRVEALPLTNSSYDVVVIDANNFQITGRYPGQRSTEPNVYVRLNPLPQEFASEAFDGPLTSSTGSAALNPANLFAEIKIDTEMVQYEPSAPKMYFVNFYQKILSHMNVRLTDSRNRDLPLFGANQSITGNRHFTMTIRVEIVEGVAQGEAETPAAAGHTQHTLPARFDSALLINQKNGRPGYNTPMGY